MRLLPRVITLTRASPSSRSISTWFALPALIPRSSLSCASVRRTRLFVSMLPALLRLLVPGVDVHARVAELSGGQRRRVEIARALLCPGGAVILDEPFTGLDTAARDACAEVVLDLLDGRMLLLATHDAVDAQALNISDIITL